MKARKLFQEIKPYLNHKNAIIVTGARQVGKTTLLRQFYDLLPQGQKIWFDLENPLHQKNFEDSDYDAILKNIQNKGLHPKKRKYVFIDEIQNFPEITKIIKYLIDHYKIKFFVTGSSSFYMKNLFPESLTGRKFIFNLFPLDFQEFLYFKGYIKILSKKKKNALDLQKKSYLEFKKFEKEYQEYLEYGGFPEVVLASTIEEKKLILENIFTSFFEKDILQLSDYQNVREIRDLILLLTQRIGSRLDITRLAQELGINRYKVYSYLEFLQATFLIKLVSVYTKSIDRKIAGGKKVYFLDTGLLNQIAKIKPGELFENAIARALSQYGNITYYHTKSQEVDFILAQKLAFEVKLKATKSDFHKLQTLSKVLGIEENYVISQTYNDHVEKILYPQFL